MLFEPRPSNVMGRGDDEALNLQFLFQDFEERFNLPAFLVNNGNRIWSSRPVYGSLSETSGICEIIAKRFDAVQQMRTCLQGSQADELDRLIFEGGRFGEDLIVRECRSGHGSLRARDEESTGNLVHLENMKEVLSFRSSTMTMHGEPTE